jgi:hypothetical protein
VVHDGDVSDVDTSGFPTLYRHDTDSEPPSGWVTYLQQMLQLNGQDPGTVDGLFGPRTEGAVQAFQAASSCTPDGVVGNQTWAALHGQTAEPGVNRTNPHLGGGHGGGGGVKPDDIGDQRIYFSTDPGYSSADDRIHMELVTTHAEIPSGTIVATLTVRRPGGSEDLMQNFLAEEDLHPVKYVTFSSIPIRSPEVGDHTATIVLDSGHGNTRSFTFQPVVDLDQGIFE